MIAILTDESTVDKIRGLIKADAEEAEKPGKNTADKDMEEDYARAREAYGYQNKLKEVTRNSVLIKMAKELQNSPSNYLFAQYLHFFRKHNLLKK